MWKKILAYKQRNKKNGILKTYMKLVKRYQCNQSIFVFNYIAIKLFNVIGNYSYKTISYKL